MYPIERGAIAVSDERTGVRIRYLEILGAAAIIILLLMLYGRILADLAKDWWTDDSASYGMLIPPLAAYLAWVRRSVTLCQPVVPNWRGLIVVAAGCGMLLLGTTGAEFFLARTSLIVILTGLLWLFWGSARLGTLAFPLVLLATMIPLPNLIYNLMAAPLQLLASNIASAVAQSLGVTVFQDGNIIYLAGISLGVSEACSGLHSLSSLAVGSLLMGYLQFDSLTPRVILFLLSLPLAVAVNILRVAGTAILADHWQQIAMGFYHMFSGWLVFVLGFFALMGLAKILALFFRRKAVR